MNKIIPLIFNDIRGTFFVYFVVSLRINSGDTIFFIGTSLCLISPIRISAASPATSEVFKSNEVIDGDATLQK